MFRNTSRLLIAVAIMGVVVSVVGMQPAAASSKTGNLILGLAAGVIIGAALSDNDCPRYCPPPPVYVPPPPPCPPRAYYYSPGPRVVTYYSYPVPVERHYYAPRSHRR